MLDGIREPQAGIRAGPPELVAKALERHAVPPRLICPEITESGVMNYPARALETLERLHAQGLPLPVDHFGTGHSSLDRWPTGARREPARRQRYTGGNCRSSSWYSSSFIVKLCSARGNPPWRTSS